MVVAVVVVVGVGVVVVVVVVIAVVHWKRISQSVAGPLPVHHSSFHNPGLQYIAIQLTEVPPLGSPGAQKVKFAETLDDSQTKSPSLALSDPPSHL